MEELLLRIFDKHTVTHMTYSYSAHMTRASLGKAGKIWARLVFFFSFSLNLLCSLSMNTTRELKTYIYIKKDEENPNKAEHKELRNAQFFMFLNYLTLETFLKSALPFLNFSELNLAFFSIKLCELYICRVVK